MTTNTTTTETTSMTTTATFTVGITYECRAMGDHELIYSFTVIARTAKFVTFTDRWGDTKRVGVWMSDNVEKATPNGRYANCAVVSANRSAA